MYYYKGTSMYVRQLLGLGKKYVMLGITRTNREKVHFAVESPFFLTNTPLIFVYISWWTFLTSQEDQNLPPVAPRVDFLLLHS